MRKVKAWSEDEDKILIDSIRSGFTAKQIAQKIGRSEKAVGYRCSRLHIDVAETKNKTQPKAFDLADVKCPFIDMLFRGKSIKCEGLGESGYIILGYKNETEWMNHVNRYCNREYKKCPVAQALYKKYGEN